MKNHTIILLFIALLVLLFPLYSHAEEYATFESFYKNSSSIGWLIAVFLALVAAAVIYFTGGTASPIVISIGTWIGNMMGLSGIAATNAGLALLGGGSLASGGFGIIGGVAVLTAALSFGTDVVIDFTAGNAIAEYQYSKFIEQSKTMTTIPIPVNDEGPNSYKAAIKILDDNINSEEPIFSNYNQNIIEKALQTLKETDDSRLFSEAIESGENSQKESLYAILYFLLNEYEPAKEHALSAIVLARERKSRRTLPAFIFAASSLYEENYNFQTVTEDYFRYSILAEPDNPIIPLLFSIYLDRMMYRFNDGFLSASSLQLISNIAIEESLRDKKAINYSIILARYFIRLKLEQQKISSLALTDNKTIKNSPKTLFTITKSLNEYSLLLRGANSLMENLLFDDYELGDESKKQTNEFYMLLKQYRKDKTRLKTLIDKLEKYQSSAKDMDILDKEKQQNQIILYLVVFLICLLVLTIGFICRINKETR